jgi:osmoprotectant transport system permease protein
MDTLGDFVDFLTSGEAWWGSRGLIRRTAAHLWISALATLLTVVLAVPTAVLLARRRRGRGGIAIAVANALRAVPTFAVLALAFAVFVRFQSGLTMWPTLVALVVLGIPPTFANTFVGVRDVDPGVLDAARGMGMTAWQRLRTVELPIAAPLALAGIRTSAVQITATATLGAFVGYQNLGSFILEGLTLGRRGYDRLLAGAVTVALLSLLVELVFDRVERHAVPWTRPRRRLAVDAAPEPAPAGSAGPVG